MSIPFGATIPFVNHLGFTLEKFEGGQSELHYAPRAEHLNSFAVTHGGALQVVPGGGVPAPLVLGSLDQTNVAVAFDKVDAALDHLLVFLGPMRGDIDGGC